MVIFGYLKQLIRSGSVSKVMDDGFRKNDYVILKTVSPTELLYQERQSLKLNS